jgi:DNA-binding NarL/FixJ family response regulator
MSASEKSVSILIADNQFLITESLRIILNNKGYQVSSTVVTLKNELNNTLTREEVSMLIIDPSHFDLASFSELKEIKDTFPDLKILVITNSLISSELHELNNIGITGIILKTAGKEEIFDAVNATLKGRKYYSNELMEILLEADERKKKIEETGQLTNSEMEIVRLISEGLTTKEIAAKKFISFHTVISHRKNIFRKLGVTSVSELIMYSIKAGWINTIEYYI